jgi:ABC-type lipoprotein release transport system permease subunit
MNLGVEGHPAHHLAGCFTAMPVVLAAAALPASYLPARRAVAVDPVETMRTE